MKIKKQEQPLSEGVGVLALSLTVHVALAAIVLLRLSWGFQNKKTCLFASVVCFTNTLSTEYMATCTFLCLSFSVLMH